MAADHDTVIAELKADVRSFCEARDWDQFHGARSSRRTSGGIPSKWRAAATGRRGEMQRRGTHVRRNLSPPLSVGAAVVLVACGTGQSPDPRAAGHGPDADGSVAIVDVSVLPMTHDVVLEHQTVLIRDGRIVSVGPAGEVVPGAGARVVDGAGRYLIPGLADMHTHVYGETELLIYVANGVTRIRNMWGSHTSLAMRARADSGAIVSPQITTAGRLVDGESPVWGSASAVVTDPATARRVMDEEKAAGFDFLKVYEQLSSETFDTIMAHSARIGHPVAGHVPREVPLEHALRSGMASIEHLSGWASATTVHRPGSPAEAAAILRQIESGELGWDVLYDPERRQRLAARAAESGVWHVPTLSWSHRVYTSRRQAPDRFARFEMRYVSPRRRAQWDPNANSRLERLSDDILEAIQTLVKVDQLRVRALYEAGARILVGTDAQNPFVLPGFAIHEELGLLVDAGLSPYDALVAATRGPAEFLGHSDEGTVEPGSKADLVLLESNPLDDVTATRDMAGVVLRGRWFPREELDALLESVVERYRQPDDWFADLAPMPGGVEVLVYETRSPVRQIRAERLGHLGAEGSERVAIAQRSTKLVSGGQMRETVRITTLAGGSLAELTYQQAQASGTAEATVRMTNQRLTVTGRTVDGQPVEESLDLASGELVACEMIACLTPMLTQVEGIGIGARRRFHTRTLIGTVGSNAEPSGNPVFVPEIWEWERAQGSDDARVYQVTVSRNGGQRALAVTADGDGLLQLEPSGPRSHTTRRVE